MGNECKGKYCYKPDYSEILHSPMEIFKQIVRIQAIVRGFIARRRTKILKANLKLLLHERNLLKEYGFPKLNHILTAKLLRRKVTIQQNENYVYIGEVNDKNEPHGIGRILYSNQSYKEGEFVNGYLRKGTYYFQGNLLNGMFSNNLLHGRGKSVFKDGTVYEGGFEKGVRNGYGKLLDSKGNIFEGQFKNGVLNGEGEYIGVEGKYYIGNWVDGKFHGQGELLYPDGKKYIGQFKMHFRHGYGELITQEGKYSGQWKNGHQCGEGLLQYNGKETRCFDGKKV